MEVLVGGDLAAPRCTSGCTDHRGACDTCDAREHLRHIDTIEGVVQQHDDLGFSAHLAEQSFSQLFSLFEGLFGDVAHSGATDLNIGATDDHGAGGITTFNDTTIDDDTLGRATDDWELSPGGVFERLKEELLVMGERSIRDNDAGAALDSAKDRLSQLFASGSRVTLSRQNGTMLVISFW